MIGATTTNVGAAVANNCVVAVTGEENDDNRQNKSRTSRQTQQGQQKHYQQQPPESSRLASRPDDHSNNKNEHLALKQMMNAIHSRRKRDQRRVEFEQLQQEAKELIQEHDWLKTQHRNLTTWLEKAQQQLLVCQQQTEQQQEQQSSTHDNSCTNLNHESSHLSVFMCLCVTAMFGIVLLKQVVITSIAAAPINVQHTL